ncbi:MAG: hypothetical protein Q7U36_01065 [bacterium]|nr:hypothetical protein [bacterium]
MEYSKKPLTGECLKEKETEMFHQIIFFKTKKGKNFVCSIVSVSSDELDLVSLRDGDEGLKVKFKEIAKWCIPTKVQLAKEIIRLTA